ncbi:hypothetical protein BDR07DRAFT_1371709 [Suillus spraguei]|nr:hypothetical protein BDR07DRAFT_1371709 [Suillus spraguei]
MSCPETTILAFVEKEEQTLSNLSYFIAASAVVVTYDWALTFGEEVELIWDSKINSGQRKRWSFTTALFLGVRYIGISFAAYGCLKAILPSNSLTNKDCEIINSTLWFTGFVVDCMLDVIMITRLFAMHQQSRKVLILLVVILLAIMIPCGVIAAIQTRQISGAHGTILEDLILPGTHQCPIGASVPLTVEFWLLGTAWEVFTLCLALRSAIKRFRELQQPWRRWTIGDCFTDSTAIDTWIYGGVTRVFSLMQMFIVGPRLLLDIRRYHARRVADSNVETVMSMMVFHEHTQVLTSNDV